MVSGIPLRKPPRPVNRYCITDSAAVAASAAASGVSMIQIRAKSLSARALYQLTLDSLAVVGPSRLLVNTRADIALAARAHGVHLPANSLSPTSIRRIAPPGFLIGVSCHTLTELAAAAHESADFAVFAPIFPTPSKPGAVPLGLEALREACSLVSLPIYALGGITESNAPLCIEAGATGIAGISLFITVRQPPPTASP